MEEEKKEKKGFFRRLKDGLSKTRSSIICGFDNVFTAYSEIDDDFHEEIEEILMEYRKYLADLRGETMISNVMLSQLIGRILKENA
jgi:signal recognition particle GTPase